MPPIDSTLTPKLKAPAGTCDTHMHVYDGRYPKAPTAQFVPPDAPVWFSACLLVAIVLTTASWYTLVALTMSTDLIARRYGRVERALTAVTGAIFVGVSARLATEP